MTTDLVGLLTRAIELALMPDGLNRIHQIFGLPQFTKKVRMKKSEFPVGHMSFSEINMTSCGKKDGGFIF